jgi:hypothetical protein
MQTMGSKKTNPNSPPEPLTDERLLTKLKCLLAHLLIRPKYEKRDR